MRKWLDINNLSSFSKIKKSRASARDFQLSNHFLEQLQLLFHLRTHRSTLSIEQFHAAKLLIGNVHYSYLSLFRQHTLNSGNMYLRILIRGAMAQIDGKLKHSETVSYQAFSEIGRGLAFLFSVRWQVEKNEHPHNTVFFVSTHQNSGYSTVLLSPPKQWAREDVVVVAAIIKGLRLPSICTSMTGMPNNSVLTSFVN